MTMPDDPRLAPLSEREATDTAGGLSLIPIDPFLDGPYFIPLGGDLFPWAVRGASRV